MNLRAPIHGYVRPSASASVITLSMTHLSPFGLSEQWLLRECGDRHWDLISQAMGQAEATFRDRSGRPVYAAFCATSLTFGDNVAVLGERIERRSELFSISASRLGSIHVFLHGGQVLARMEMMSTFISHDDTGSNERVIRNLPSGEMALPYGPPELMHLADRARDGARASRAEPCHSGSLLLEITPNPSLDFNAVGLLYFPTYSRLAELACPAPTPLVAREVYYFANIEMGGLVRVHEGPSCLQIMRGDGRVLAQIRSSYADD